MLLLKGNLIYLILFVFGLNDQCTLMNKGVCFYVGVFVIHGFPVLNLQKSEHKRDRD